MNRDRITTPVLLIAFNRPSITQQVFDQIKKVRPTEFYLACDGPRKDRDGELELVQQVRELVKQVDWDCNVHTLFREENVGCGFGPSGAISWAFETAERLIVLEDDCCPSLSFFYYCEEMLERYADDKRVWIVSGLSIHPNSTFFGDNDYLFSRYAHTWGWATWKNRWAEFDLYMTDASAFLANGEAYNVFCDKKQADRVNKRIKTISESINDEVSHSWDYQWYYTRMKNDSRDIVPRINLIKNLGADNGTHTTNESIAVNMIAEEFDFPLRHPAFVLKNKAYDEFHYKNYLHITRWHLLKQALRDPNKCKYLFGRLLHKISQIFKKY